jgi:hypothetical protein
MIPKRWQRRSAGHLRNYSKIDFYEKLIKLLRSLGLRRQSHQTPQEFLNAAGETLSQADFKIDTRQLSNAFYARRFGQFEKLDPQQSAWVQETLNRLEEAIRNGLGKKLKP